MASAVSLSPFSLRARNARSSPVTADATRQSHLPPRFAGRRQVLLSLTAATVVAVRESPSMAEDIPLFGIRKKLRKAEEEAVEIVKEGFETAERGVETAERGIENAERGIETAEREISTAVSFGGLAQAGAVAGAEVIGVLIATSVVNGILGPEARKS